MKKGLILTNAYSSAANELNGPLRLKQEFEKLGVCAEIRRNDGFLAYIGEGGAPVINVSADFCVYLDKDKYTSFLLEKGGFRLFNSHFSVQACDDKAVTHALLSGCGIPMPETYTAPLCYTPSEPVRAETLDLLEEKLGYPMIVKSCYGSLGEGVFKIDDRLALAEICEKLKCKPHLFQRCVTESLGRDLRVIVIGGKCVAAMERRSDADFRSNIELGGRGLPVAVPADAARIYEAVADILKLDYCGIDLLFGKDGFLLCEVNSNAFFGGIERVTGVNVAKLYAEYIFKQIYG